MSSIWCSQAGLFASTSSSGLTSRLRNAATELIFLQRFPHGPDVPASGVQALSYKQTDQRMLSAASGGGEWRGVLAGRAAARTNSHLQLLQWAMEKGCQDTC